MSSSITPDTLRALLDKKESLTLIDVRRKADYEASPETIEGAEWKNPEAIDDWSNGLDPEKQVVAYCVKGGAVSRSVRDRLQQVGFNAVFLEGGIKAWQSSISEDEQS